MQVGTGVGCKPLENMKTYYVVKITLGVNDVYYDAILGLNADDALRRAECKWDGRVEIISDGRCGND